jgi:hypothetical protein
MEMKKAFKRNWDLILTYLLPVLSILVMFTFLSGCHDWGCLGIVVIGIMFALGFAILFSIITLIRTFRNKSLKKIRLLWVLPVFIIVIWFILKYFGLFSGSYFATTFIPFNAEIPTSLEECNTIGGISIPKELECPQGFLETSGNAGENNLCCLKDICPNGYERNYNSDLKVFEKGCRKV